MERDGKLLRPKTPAASHAPHPAGICPGTRQDQLWSQPATTHAAPNAYVLGQASHSRSQHARCAEARPPGRAPCAHASRAHRASKTRAAHHPATHARIHGHRIPGRQGSPKNGRNHCRHGWSHEARHRGTGRASRRRMDELNEPTQNGRRGSSKSRRSARGSETQAASTRIPMEQERAINRRLSPSPPLRA